MAVMDERRASRPVQIAGLILLVASALYYLQFGLQALIHFLPQGTMALVGALALGWGAVRIFRRRPSSAIAFLGTIPLLLLHAVMTLVEPGELPFLIGSIPVPLVAGAAWLVGRSRKLEST